MGSHSQELTDEERCRRFLYTSSYHGAYITGNPEKHYSTFDVTYLLQWAKKSLSEFERVLTAVNEEPLLVRRTNMFYIIAKALHFPDIPIEDKLKIKELVFKFVKSDEEFFDFIKFYTLYKPRNRKQKITVTLKKMIIRFYKEKSPEEFAKCVGTRESYHGWTHRDLIAMCHFKCTNLSCLPAVSYALFGPSKLPELNDENKSVVEFLKNCHELRVTENIDKAKQLIPELKASIDQVNSKLNKDENVWYAITCGMNPREILQHLYRFYKFGFLKNGSAFLSKVNEILCDPQKVKQCNLHPVEVFIYLKFFEKGGKPLDPKLIDFLKTKEIKPETLKKMTTPNEPKCKSVIQSINKSLKASYDNVQPTGKRFLITIDVTEKVEDACFHNRRIPVLEAALAITRFLCKVERNVTVAVFKDNQINFVDISKSHSAVEKLQEHKADYIVPSAPIEYAKNKKKQIDVFINFMSCNWYTSIPNEVREKMQKIPEALNKYCQKMKTPDTKVVKIFLGGPSASYSENSKNILSIAGFTVEVPKVLEAFCRGQFC